MKTMILLIVLGIVALIDAAVLLKLRAAFRLLKVPNTTDAPVGDTPSVTICIAARDETHAMTQCLERVVASEYPKLEVIVLDDGSRDDTGVLIKSFAHAGVRFIEGKPLPDGWLGKNYAQKVLAEEASGKLVFFMDVDTLIERHTVARAVATMLARGDRMLSIVPLRADMLRPSLVFTTMRHFWLLMRHSSEHPRATANAWLIDRELLLGEFSADTSLPQSMKVETAIARKLGSDSYHLILSNAWLGLCYEKKWSSQVETSVRVLYPQCGYHWYQVLLLTATLLVACTPYIAWIFTPWALLLVVLQYVIAFYYLSHLWVRHRLIGALLLPYTLLQEAMLLVYSMYKYKTHGVTWKGRPILRTK